MIFLTSHFFTISLFNFQSMHPDERQIERAENTTFISVNDTPSLNGKATRTDGWGTDFSEVICWSNHGIRMDALFRHKLFFFLSFSRVDTFFVLFTYTQSERLRRFFYRWVQVIYYWVQNQQGSAQYKDRESANLPTRPALAVLQCFTMHMKN